MYQLRFSRKMLKYEETWSRFIKINPCEGGREREPEEAGGALRPWYRMEPCEEGGLGGRSFRQQCLLRETPAGCRAVPRDPAVRGGPHWAGRVRL